jgi:hypothetical protein
MIHTDPFVLKLNQYIMKTMTAKQTNQFKIDELCLATKTLHEINSGGIQN